MDCEKVENAYDVTNRQMADLDWLLYHAPMEYTPLVLSGEMEQYLSGAMFHGLEDWSKNMITAKLDCTRKCSPVFYIFAQFYK